MGSLLISALLISGLVSVHADSHGWHWGYTDGSGPASWPNHVPDCGGQKQSPIDIPFAVTYDNSLGSFTFTNYDNMAAADLELVNNGHTAQITIGNPGAAKLSGGGLDGSYVAAQLHFHWGADNSKGSEHTFRGQSYPLEMHIVHYKEAYGTLGAAANKSDGIAVLGFWFNEGERNNNLDTLISGLFNVSHQGQSAAYTGTSFSAFLTSSTNNYYRYMGSLTTPTCNEAVVWTVFEHRNHLSPAQMAVFRNLFATPSGDTSKRLVDNFRPVQTLNDRTVSSSFDTANVNDYFHWGYHGESGAANWHLYYEDCSKDRQSPVDIIDADTTLDTDLGFLSPQRYSDNMDMSILNNGHTVQLVVTSDHYLSGGGLDGSYKVAQVHFHWGSSNMKGSEHLRDSKAAPIEIHIVHYKDSAGSVASAISQGDGLAVLGAFFKIEANDNEKLTTLIQKLADVKYKGSEVALSGFSLADLTFADLDRRGFFRYEGSLTTPSCDESVIWTVLHDTIAISESQLVKFRELTMVKEADKDKAPLTAHDYIVDNFRPVQPLGSRKVQSNVAVVSTSSATSIRASVFTSGTFLLLLACLFIG